MRKTIRFFGNRMKADVKAEYQKLSADARRFGYAVTTKGGGDYVIVLGGDGTLLRAVHEFPDTPILGLNFGGLGYLSSVDRKESPKIVERISSGQYSISERRMIEVNGQFAALNDIVVTREMTGHAAIFDLEADGIPVTRYMADGLVFATPTGSTAYSLAAGGPVLLPDTNNFVVTPLNPHALGVRPLVVRDTVCFKVTVRKRTPGNSTLRVGVYSDAENVMTLEEEQSIEISKSDKTAKLIEMEGYDPYSVLAHKLGWSGSNVKS